MQNRKRSTEEKLRIFFTVLPIVESVVAVVIAIIALWR